MITRYTRPEMAKIWSDENRYNCWLEVEILADEAWAELGEIPKEDVEKIRKNAKFTVERIWKLKKKQDMMLLHLQDVSLKVLVKKRNGFTTD